jgi:PIN domain nuclease of toxin-antitoxin system
MILLDTHAAVWLASDQSKLSAEAKNVITSHADALHISVVSVWEISMLYKRKRLQLPIAPELYLDRMIKQHALIEVPLSRQVAQRSVRLPDIPQ